MKKLLTLFALTTLLFTATAAAHHSEENLQAYYSHVKAITAHMGLEIITCEEDTADFNHVICINPGDALSDPEAFQGAWDEFATSNNHNPHPVTPVTGWMSIQGATGNAYLLNSILFVVGYEAENNLLAIQITN